MKKWSEYTNKQKLLIVACSLGVICGGTFGGYQAYAANQQATEKQALQQALHAVTEKGSLTNAILSFQDADGFLTEYLVNGDLETIQKQLEALKKQCDTFEEQYPDEKIKEEQDISEQEELLQLVEKKLVIQDQVNALFTTETPAINGSTVNKDLALADGVDKESIDQIETTDDTLPKDKWLESIEALKTVANEQLTAIETADKAVSACYKDKKVASNVTKKNYEEAEKAVKAVKRESDKERLTKKLAEIKKVVEENEKKAKEKEKEKKAEQKSTSSAETKNQTETAATVTEETAVADTTNEVSTNNAGGSWSSTGSVTGSGNTSSGSTSGGVSNGSGTTSNGASSSDNGSSNSGSSNSVSNNGGSGTSSGGSGNVTENTPSEPTIVSGYIGNSGKVFNSALEANTWANEILATDSSKNGYYTVQIFYSDGSKKFSIDWY